MSQERGYAYFKGFEQVFSQEEVDEFLVADSDFFVEYVQETWLKRYFQMVADSKRTEIPSITSVISDTPPSNTNAFKSKTEDGALRSLLANDWITHFHEKIELLPMDYQDIIKEKFLKRGTDGRLPSDIQVYNELAISKTPYYRMKKLALEELGRLLYPH